MSATLVGSEMCIRDSGCVLQASTVKDISTFKAAHYDHDGGNGSLPVSYTHLTLPTICSV
eukprot:15013805-Alexandrium_andersonii.AAC.1